MTNACKNCGAKMVPLWRLDDLICPKDCKPPQTSTTYYTVVPVISVYRPGTLLYSTFYSTLEDAKNGYRSLWGFPPVFYEVELSSDAVFEALMENPKHGYKLTNGRLTVVRKVS